MSASEVPSGMVPAMAATVTAQIAYGRLLRLIQTGEVRGQRVGRKWYADPSDLARWRREQVEPATA